MGNKVIELQDYKPHRYSEVICIKCHHRYICVRPEIVLLKDLECENCGKGFIIETGEILDVN